MPHDTSLPRSVGTVISLTAAAMVAIAFPTFLAFNLPPSSTFFNQAAALLGWGVFIVLIGSVVPWPSATLCRQLLWLLVPLALLAISAMASIFLNRLPVALGISAIGVMLAAALALIAGAASRQSNHSRLIFRSFCVAIVVAGVVGTMIGSIQVFAPEWTDGTWLAAAASDGRASSNLRQPNHLSSLLVWALVAAVWLWQSQTVRATVCLSLLVFFVFGIVLTGSRTGIADVVVLAVWGMLDRKLPRSLRMLLLLTPILYALFWWGLAQWAHSTHHVFGGESRMGAQGDISSSRYAIWANTLSLIAQRPWFGVGFGEFNFAWSLTPFPNRPVAFFDHTHNIALQFAVELGVPLAILIMSAFLCALWFAFRASQKASQPIASMIRAAWLIVLTIGVHSLLEYPLWYSYFLLPAAFAFGFCLGRDSDTSSTIAPEPTPTRPRGSLIFVPLGLVLVIGAVGAVVDYKRVVAIFDSDESAPLAARIAAGQHSVFFDYHADYAAVTTAMRPSEQMPAFSKATHNLLDTRLMIAWAKAYAAQGDFERAKHLAQRLREFRNDDSTEYFAICDTNPNPRPYQCEAPTRVMDYRDFR